MRPWWWGIHDSANNTFFAAFGPIVGVMSAVHDDEALALMQDTDFGLTAGVFGEGAAAAERLLRLDVGTGYVNLCDRTSPLTPRSGRRHSGRGARVHGRPRQPAPEVAYVYLFFLETQCVL